TQPGADDPRVKEGFAAYQRSEFKKAYDIWLPLAEAGNAEAQFRVGRLYSFGDGLHLDPLKAIRWYNRALKNGHLMAAFNVGVHFGEFSSAHYDLKRSVESFLIGANAGDVDAQRALAFAHIVTHIRNQDFAEAYKWFFVAQKNGDPRSNQEILDLDKFATKAERLEGEQRMREWFKTHSRSQ
ncbi:unnamed protein product, partial [Laminaria digitata]